jgi:hypothetical protein
MMLFTASNHRNVGTITLKHANLLGISRCALHQMFYTNASARRTVVQCCPNFPPKTIFESKSTRNALHRQLGKWSCIPEAGSHHTSPKVDPYDTHQRVQEQCTYLISAPSASTTSHADNSATGLPEKFPCWVKLEPFAKRRMRL